MKGRRDLVWVGHDGVSHRLRTYERWANGHVRCGTTMCGIGLDLTLQDLRKGGSGLHGVRRRGRAYGVNFNGGKWMSIQVQDPSRVVHALMWADTTKCRRKTLWRERWKGTRDEVSCMACVVSDEPSFRDGA
jgi:hypothetical protein